MDVEYYLEKELYDGIKNDNKIFGFIKENLCDGLWYWDLENPDNEWIDPGFISILGYSTDDSRNCQAWWRSLVFEDDQKLLIDKLKKHISETDSLYDQIVQFRHKDGSLLWFRYFGKAIRSHDGHPLRMLGAFQNVTDSVKAEEYFKALTEAKMKEGLLWEMSNRLPLAIASAKGVSQKFNFLNDRFIDLFGFQKDELILLSDWWKLAYPDKSYREEVYVEWEEKIGRVAASNTMMDSMDSIVTCKDKSRKYIRWTYISIGDEHWAFGLDLTDQKQTEKDLINAKEKADTNANKIQSLFDNMLEGCQVLDFDWKYLYINKAAERHNQRPNSELIGRKYADMWPGIEETKVFELIKSCLEDRKFYHLENEFVFPSGDVGWFDLSIQPVEEGVFILSIDVTNKKNAELALRRSEHDLKKAQEITHIGNWHLDLKTNEVFWTEELYKMYGLNPELPPPPVNEQMKLFTSESWDKLSSALGITKETGAPYELELETVRIDGSTGWIWVRGEAGFDEDGSISSIWGAVQDISESKKVRVDLKNAKERAEQNDQLKTAFLQNMSHEIRTPLNAIKGFSGLLCNDMISEDQKKEFVSIIRNSSDQLISIVTDILTISSLETRQENIFVSEVSVNSILSELYAIYEPKTKDRKLYLFEKNDLNDRSSEVYTDRIKLFKVLFHLLSNALKFTHEGGIEFGYKLMNNESLLFFVKDTGIGIKPERSEVIFGRFQQSGKEISRNYGGNGLGLSIAKGFVDLLGGDIWVESSLGKGATFYFTIPYNPVKIEQTTIMETQKNKMQVLVAEDEEYNYLYLEVILQSLGLDVLHTVDGKETILAVRDNPEIDMILMDIKMPLMDGHDAAKIIKAEYPHIPILAQSAYGLEHEYQRYRDVFDDYLIKPIDEKDLKVAVSRFLKLAEQN